MNNKPFNSIIMVVDDDPIQRMLFKESLSGDEFAVIEAKDGLDAVNMFSEFQPNLIIMDVEMPRMNGFEACHKIRELPNGDLVSIIITTGLEDDSSIAQAYTAGATDFMLKPVNWTIIKHRIRYMLRSYQMMTELQAKKIDNQVMIKAIPDTLLTLDAKGLCIEYHPGSLENDVLPATMQGNSIFDYLKSDANEVFRNSLARIVEEKNTRTFEFSQSCSGKNWYFEARLVRKNEMEVLAIIRDISAKKANEEKIWKLAYYDSLTGVPNRRMIRDKVHQEFEYAKANNKIISLLYIDLDRFNHVNNTYGNSVGDALLKLVVERLTTCFRERDLVALNKENKDSQVARLGGDQFVVLLTDIDRVESVTMVAARIMKLFTEPFQVDEREIHLTPTLGIASYPYDANCSDELFIHANTALSLAKKAGRNHFLIYDSKMDSDRDSYLQLEGDLRRCVENEQLELYYQPQFDIQKNRVVGVEALIRWQHPQLGMISPVTFIPLAEELGLINVIGEWVLKQACFQMQQWQKMGILIDSIGINLSAQQFNSHHLVECVSTLLEQYGLDPQVLDLEITEGTIMEDADMAVDILNQLKELGVKISIDDFGTGYSSLSYLQQFPIDKLKIDRCFVSQLEKSRTDEKIIKVVLSLAEVLGLDVVAEGIENANQLNILAKHNCCIIQGYYFSKPLNASDFEAFYLQSLKQQNVSR